MAFEAIKKEITSAPYLKYYDPSKPLTLETDASLKGLGAILLEKESFQLHQKAYVATELESLAVAWTIERFYNFLFCKRFQFETEQKPLENILTKILIQATSRQ